MTDIETALNNLDAGKYEPSMAGSRDRHADIKLVRETLAGLRRKINEQSEDIRDLLELRKERDAMRAELDAANRRAEYWKAEHIAANAELDALKAQEPFDAEDSRFREAFDAVIMAGNWPCTRQGDGYRSPMTDIALRVAFAVINRLKLYARPVPPAPSVPDGWQLVPKRITPHMGHAIEACLDDACSIQAMWDAALTAAPQPERAASNSIGVEAVCVVVDGLDGKRIDWLIEGGLGDLPEGTTLIFAHQAITGADGWGEVFLAAPRPERKNKEGTK